MSLTAQLQEPHVQAAAPTIVGTRPAILMLTYISPLQRWGSAQRSRLLMNALQRHGQLEVLVLSFTKEALPLNPLTVSEIDGVKVMDLQIAQRGLRGRPRFDLLSNHVSAAVAHYVDLGRFDLLVSRYARPALKLALPSHMPLIVDFDDAVYEPPWRALHTPKHWVGVFLRLFNDRLITRTRLREAKWRDAQFLFCRQAERRVFGHLNGAVLPNLPPATGRAGPPDFSMPARPALMFVGLLDYMPNHDAVDWFLIAVWPMVRQAVPAARFLIVGEGQASRLARWSAHAQVQTLGFVDSLAQAYAQATACVVPMRSGAGTNIKALEPYLYGRMVITTPLVVEGHEPLFTAGSDVLVAADAAGLAAHCIAMLAQPQRAAEIARRGHQRITSTLTLQRFQSIVDAAVAAVLPAAKAQTSTQPVPKPMPSQESR